MFDAETVIEAVVAPVLHAYVAPGLAVNITFWPAQNVVGPFAVILAAVGVTTVIVEVAELVHPAALLT